MSYNIGVYHVYSLGVFLIVYFVWAVAMRRIRGAWGNSTTGVCLRKPTKGILMIEERREGVEGC